MTNVEALKNLYAALGGNAADVADAVTNVDVLNAIAGFLGGEADANLISDAINNISAVAPTGGGDIDSLIDGSITEISSDVDRLRASAFVNCSNLTKGNFPNVTTVTGSCFSGCRALDFLEFPQVTTIEESAFSSCTSLKVLILRSSTVAHLSGGSYANPFSNTPIKSGTGYIYVPDELVDDYKAASDWSTVANQIKGLSELPTE